jgi:hypothetical protein
MIRRLRRSPELTRARARFHDVLRELEPAKAALAEVMPTNRLPGRQLPDALLEFEAGLERAAVLMPAWRRHEVDEVWLACEAGLTEARRRASRLREDAPDLGGVEGLIWAVGELLGPLEPFAAAEDRLRTAR